MLQVIGRFEALDWKKVGELLRRAREERGLTQEDIEARHGVAQTPLSHWERGAVKRPPARLISYCEVMGIDLEAMASEASEQLEEADEEKVIRLRPTMPPDVERLLPLIREIIREEIQQALNQGNQQFGRDGRISGRRPPRPERGRVIPLVKFSA